MNRIAEISRPAQDRLCAPSAPRLAAPGRRALLLTGAAALLAGCVNQGFNSRRARIDRKVRAAIDFMYQEIPETRELAARAAGMLVIPTVTTAGFGIGGSYGSGALLINDVIVGYYAVTSLSYGLQIGLGQFGIALFFMTPEALEGFRTSDGWVAGANVGYIVKDSGGQLGVDTARLTEPVIAVVFGEAGLIVGARIEGTKYTRINP